MSFLSKVKSLLPVSSRTVHAMYAELYDLLSKQRSEQAAFEGQASLMLWELYRREGESLGDAHKRLYHGLSHAEGGMRLYQLANAQLLHEFDAFCKKEGLSYWMVSGTLLGAVRHRGFIPWDDDLDVGMLRADLDALILAAEKDDRYRLSVRYDRLALCRQIRFGYADESIPCFVDVFSFDPVAHADAQTFDCRESAREQLKSELVSNGDLGFWNETDYYLDTQDGRAPLVSSHFINRIKSLYDDGVFVEDINDAEGIIWGIDNNDSFVRHHDWYLIPKEAIFPLQTLSFEGFDLNSPADADKCLSDIYGDIYELPDDLASHYHHVSQREIAEGEVGERLKEVISRS